ncbi:MAG: YceI family protein [Bacteroidia bacterium]|nr:YceI family protein [Bacteroidia bacterium]
MTKLKNVALLIVFALSSLQLLPAQTKWTVDKSHTDIRFTAVHYLISEVDGEFKEFEGSVTTNSEDFTGAEVEFVANVASINTDNERRDNHLKSDDFFNAEKYPELKFKGKIQKEGDKYHLVGDFTMRDVTKPIKFDVKYNGSVDLGERGKKAGFKITGVVDRFEYGIQFNRALETGGLVVSQEIQITCNVEMNLSKG